MMISPEQLLALLRDAIESAPLLDTSKPPDEKLMRWFGKTVALIEQVDSVTAIRFRHAQQSRGVIPFRKTELMQALYDAYYKVELNVPAEQSGVFIPPGDTWNGYAALVKIVQSACDSLLIIDPYIGSEIFMELIPHAVANNGVRILTAKNRSRHDALLASSQRWKSTHTERSKVVEVRYAGEGALHDRLIMVDKKEVWLVSQSLKDIAKRSAASVKQADAQLAEWKITHYESLWQSSTTIS